MGLGVALGIAILGATIFLLRRRRLKEDKREGVNHDPTYFDGKGEMDAGLESLAPQELPGAEPNEPQELEGSEIQSPQERSASERRKPQEFVGSEWNSQELMTRHNTHEIG